MCHRCGVGTLARARASQAKKTLLARDRSSAGSSEQPVSHPGRSKLTRESSDEGRSLQVFRHSPQSCTVEPGGEVD